MAQLCPTLCDPMDCSIPGPCPSPTPGTYSNACPFSQWCHPTISSSVIPFSSCPQSFPASGSFPVSQFFASGGQSIGVSASASVLPMNIQDWFPLGLTGWISCLRLQWLICSKMKNATESISKSRSLCNLEGRTIEVTPPGDKEKEEWKSVKELVWNVG